MITLSILLRILDINVMYTPVFPREAVYAGAGRGDEGGYTSHIYCLFSATYTMYPGLMAQFLGVLGTQNGPKSGHSGVPTSVLGVVQRLLEHQSYPLFRVVTWSILVIAVHQRRETRHEFPTLLCLLIEGTILYSSHNLGREFLLCLLSKAENSVLMFLFGLRHVWTIAPPCPVGNRLRRRNSQGVRS